VLAPNLEPDGEESGRAWHWLRSQVEPSNLFDGERSDGMPVEEKEGLGGLLELFDGVHGCGEGEAGYDRSVVGQQHGRRVTGGVFPELHETGVAGCLVGQ